MRRDQTWPRDYRPSRDDLIEMLALIRVGNHLAAGGGKKQRALLEQTSQTEKHRAREALRAITGEGNG